MFFLLNGFFSKIQICFFVFIVVIVCKYKKLNYNEFCNVVYFVLNGKLYMYFLDIGLV